MTTTFAEAPAEQHYLTIDDELTTLKRQSVVDTLVDMGDIQFPSWGSIAMMGAKEYPVTRSAFIQLLHFVSLNWEDVEDWEPEEVLKAVQDRLLAKPRQLMHRTKSKSVQAELSPNLYVHHQSGHSASRQ